MNTRTLLFCLLTTTSIVHAAPPDGLVIDCRSPIRPTQAQVGRLYGIDNFTAAYSARERVMRVAHIACMRGATSVSVAVELHGKDSSTADLVASDASVH